MKRWIALLAGVILAGLFMKLDFAGVDVASLEPVELVYIDVRGGIYVVQTDTGQQGVGTTAAEAMDNLEETSSGKIFLGTAEHLLVTKSAEKSISRFLKFLRPDCSVTLADGTPDMEKTAAFLDTHNPGLTLNDYRAGDKILPVLYTWEGGMILDRP